MPPVPPQQFGQRASPSAPQAPHLQTSQSFVPPSIQPPQSSVRPVQVSQPPSVPQSTLKKLWRLMFHVIIGCTFWWLLYSSIFSIHTYTLSKPAWEFFISFFPLDSYGRSDLATQIFDILPLALGVFSGLAYYLYSRHRERKGDGSDLLDRAGRYMLWFFAVYLLAVVGFFGWQLVQAAGSDFMFADVLFLGVFSAGLLYTGLPAAIVIATKAFILKKHYKVAGPRISISEWLIVLAITILACSGFGAYVYSGVVKEADTPRSSTVADLVQHPAQFDGQLVFISTEVVYGIKGTPGYAIRYYNYGELKEHADAGDSYIWVDEDALRYYFIHDNPSFYGIDNKLDESKKEKEIQKCTHPIDISRSNLLQWGLGDSLKAFASRYQVSIEDVLVYDCIMGYTTIGVFHNATGGPGNHFRMTIIPPVAAYDYNKFLHDVRGGEFTYQGYPLSADVPVFPSLEVTYPSGGETINADKNTLKIQWKAKNLPGNLFVGLVYPNHWQTCIVGKQVPVSAGEYDVRLGKGYICPTTQAPLPSGSYTVLLTAELGIDTDDSVRAESKPFTLNP